MAKVLVVDDETPIAMLLEHYLGSIGHSVKMAENPSESLNWLNREAFDVVVLDVIMQGPMDGLDVCRLLKSDPRTAGIRVLIISGVPGLESRARAAGGDAFLAKPFRLEDIKCQVTTLAQCGSSAHGLQSALAQLD